MSNLAYQLIKGNSKEELKKIKSNFFHTCITSPPYLGLRHYQAEDQIGRENSVFSYVENLLDICTEIKRTLRKDGTFWLNLGDTYCGTGHTNTEVPDPKYPAREQQQKSIPLNTYNKFTKLEGFKTKDLLGIPWEVAKALQKPILQCHECNYIGHWIKWGHLPNNIKWCPICKKIVSYKKHEDGWYLREDIIWAKKNVLPGPVKDRPTYSHEFLFLLTKNKNYYFDYYGIMEKALDSNKKLSRIGAKDPIGTQRRDTGNFYAGNDKKNKRSVWTVSVANFPEAHFATFPEELIKPCILAGSSTKGCCPKCKSPWKRTIEREKIPIEGTKEYKIDLRSLGWEPTCKCNIKEIEPCTILDPFNGAATTGLCSLKYDRNYVGIDVNENYIRMSRKRLDDLGDMNIEERDIV